MKIAISGYGRMGNEVEKIAVSRNHEVIATFDNKSQWDKLEKIRTEIDAVIDFSFPETAIDNIVRCFKSGIPIITGTTGWYDKLNEVEKQCVTYDASLFYAPNFSIGVNIFFKVNRQLAKLMNKVEGYNVAVNETHHIHKLDAPSGTAIKVAEDIIAENDALIKWENKDESEEIVLPIVSIREAEIPGTHEIIYNSEVDKLVLKHEAKSRAGFALGAVLAAEFIKDKKGIFNMDDMLKL